VGAVARKQGNPKRDLDEPLSLYPLDPAQVLRHIVQEPDKTTSDRTKPSGRRHIRQLPTTARSQAALGDREHLKGPETPRPGLTSRNELNEAQAHGPVLPLPTRPARSRGVGLQYLDHAARSRPGVHLRHRDAAVSARSLARPDFQKPRVIRRSDGLKRVLPR
jgi:hypothetical protein